MISIAHVRFPVGAALLLLLTAQIPARADNGPSAAVMTNASAGVVQVIARDCTDHNRTGSGFLWDVSTQLVTALHVIAGCREVVAYFTGSARFRRSPATRCSRPTSRCCR
jgi:S1-C subfamily serine protease